MTPHWTIPIEFLGQAGFRLDLDGVIVYIDPYLSDRVERIEGPALKRQRPAPYRPQDVTDASFLLITHDHMDHCDPDSLLPILAASPAARVVGPHEVIARLVAEGMEAARALPVSDEEVGLARGLSVLPVPAAHPQIERDSAGHLRCVGFVLLHSGRKIYHSGDTSPDDAIISRLRALGPIDVAMLPVNERNFYRDKQGIIGNMSIREAFEMAGDIAARQVIPMHYDMFTPNLTFLEELQVVYERTRPDFILTIEPRELRL